VTLLTLVASSDVTYFSGLSDVAYFSGLKWRYLL